ncbi:protein TASOR isoform X4 [Pangasianodon hypophthalmus]|uniref:protein TASOR isoform X4 n=1 Tax=Pangasianodon hypophthalmus TaxID=310915 RepID=UPI0023074F81|nr:protein TASOR isoform X4 [Pangasianodon hypophthalmus]
MACNLNEDRKYDRDGIKTSGLCLDGSESQEQLSASTTTTSKQNGDQAGCEDEQMSEQDACERRKSGLSDLKHCSTSPSGLHRSAEEWSRKTFQIPRKIKERKGLLQQLVPESWEFEELLKLLSSSYLDASSRGAFTYTKACLIHNELLEKEYIEKKRELKQAGRTDAELTDSYAFLLPDAKKTRWICEKGLSVGHARINNLGNPVKGVYLSKYSDLLQINPFEAGASGDIIIFKVMKGRLKSIFENTPKNNLEPAPKFDCHMHKNASKVTSLLSYRAFELTQQYFYEFAFEELRSRPRHVCPYAVVSFQYKGKESATAAHRLSSGVYEGHRGRLPPSGLSVICCINRWRRYTVWSGTLVNRGEELYHVCIRSPNLPFLPFKLPDKIDISMAMHLDQVKRKIPSTLLSWDAYNGTQEAMKCGLYCSLFDVMAKTKQGNCLSGLLHKMEKEKMVLVKPLAERGFLLLLSSSHLHSSNEKRGRSDRGLQALFVFQESRITGRLMSKHAGLHVDSLVSLEPKDPITEHLETFAPALHHAFYKLRSNPPKDLASAVKNQALDYLSLREHGSGRPFSVPEYRSSLDERPGPYPPQRPKSLDSVLNTYVHAPANFQLAIACLQQDMEDSGPAMVDEYSPVSDWSGSGSTRTGLAQSNGGGAQKPQGEYDKDKMEKLLKLIQLHKRALGKEDGGMQERSEDWEPAGHKRRPEGDISTGVSKYLKTDVLSNGELGRVPQGETSMSLSAVMDSMGMCDTDLREHVSHTTPIQDTQTLLKFFITALKKVSQSSATAASATTTHLMLPTQLQESLVPERTCEPAEPTAHYDRNLRARHTEDEQVSVDYLEDQMACSIGSMDLCSPSSGFEQQVQLPAEASHNRLQWRTTSTGMSTVPVTADEAGTSGTSVKDRSVPSAAQTLDSILDQEFQSLCTGIQELMERQQIFYVSQPTLPRHEATPSRLESTFSPYVSKYISPLPVQGYISTLCEKMNHMISSPAAPLYPVAPNDAVQPALAPPPPPVAPLSAALTASPTVTPAAVLPAKQSASKAKSQESLHKAASKPQTPVSTPTPTATPTAPPPAPKKQPSPARKSHPGKKTDAKLPDVSDSPKCMPIVSTALPLIPEVPPEPAQMGAPGNDMIGQIKPDVLCTLMEIMQMNAVRFYIQRGDEEENELCTEIKGYLENLGNIECDPLTYLENNCQQKFMVIIQNEDIASHVHKIPALVSLKKLTTVYFAGVDNLDDVKNRTYNELFMSGGLIVSDELILNPDFITLERLQAFLQFLEEQSMPWKWKVHCKTQKKLKELSRSNSEALDLLNLLTAYQKKHLVEFLPYHECDAPSRQAPDLDCLVKLQAQHTQLRHIIFLTEKSLDAPKFSSNGIIIASLNDLMTDFESLISRTRAEDSTLPIVLGPAEPDACMDEEDMSLDSDEDATVQAEDRAAEKQTTLPLQPVSEDTLPPLSDPHRTDLLSSCPVDYNVLKAAISHYKASKQAGTSMVEGEDNLVSFGVNPHQSYLYPNSAQWSPYSGSPGYHVSSAYSSPACSTSQGQEYSQVSSMSVTLANTVPLSQPANQANPNSSCVNPSANTAPPGLSQTSCSKGDIDPDGLSCPQPLPQAQTQSLAEDSQSFLPGSQDKQTKAMEPPVLCSSSSVPCTLPSYPDTPVFPGPIPTPPAPPVYNWAAPTGAQNSYTPGVSTAPFGKNEGAASAEGLCIGTGEGLTLNNKVDGSTSGTAPSSVQFQDGGTEKSSTSGSVMPNNQGSRTSVNSCTESHRGGMTHARGMTGGGMPSNPRGLLPRPGATMRPACRGGPHGPISQSGNRMFGPRGPMPGLMDMRRGGFRGRGVPPMPMRSRPGRGSMWGGTHCNRGYGPPKDYYSDYTY